MQIAKKVQAGFTLIELMIVVAIIGILASIALPQYQDFISKSEFQEVLSLMNDRKAGVGLCAQENNSLATCLGGWSGRLGDIQANLGTTALTNGTIDSVTTIAGGIITATATNQYNTVGAQTAVLTPVFRTTGVAGGINQGLDWGWGGSFCDGTGANYC